MGRPKKSGGTFRVPTKALEKKGSGNVKSEPQLKIIGDTNGKGDVASSDESEEEAFDLAIDDEEDESDEEDGDDDDDENDDDDYDDDDDEEDDNDEENDVRALIDQLPAELRQRALYGGVGQEDDDEEQEEDEDDDRWGKKKTYWSGDTADLEIGQDIEDAEDEETAAKQLQKKRLNKMKESDFFDDFDGGDEDAAEGDDDNMDSLMAQSRKGRRRRDKVTTDLESLVLGAGGGKKSAEVQVEVIARDLSKMTKGQKLQKMAADSPEMLGLLTEMQEQTEELTSRVEPLRKLIAESTAVRAQVTDDIVDYLEVKHQLLMCYCVNMTFYLYMKSMGLSVRSHPVMRQLLELRYAMEKMRPLDGKLKYQVERLLKLSTLDSTSDEARAATLRPNPNALLGAGSSSAGDDDEDDEEDNVEDQDEDDQDGSDIEDDLDSGRGGSRRGHNADSSSGGQKLYKAPKIAAMPYKESETEQDRREQKIEKKRKKLKNSEILETLREEFGTTPEDISSSGVAAQSREMKQLQEEADEKRNFEEERFVRLVQSRKEKKKIKKVQREAHRIGNLEDIGDIGEFEELAELTGSSGDAASASGLLSGLSFDSEGSGRGGGAGLRALAPGDALQQAVNAFVQSSSKKGKDKSGKKGVEQTDDFMAPLPDAAARRRAKASYGGEMDSSGGRFEEDDDDVGEFGDGDESSGGRKRRRAPTGNMDDDNDDGFDGDDGEQGLLETFARKKKEFLKKKKEHYTAEPHYGPADEELLDSESGKRGVTYEIMKNKGLTPHRSKLNRNPRVKKKVQYQKAQVARKGQVREVITGAAGSYPGELTGIKAGIARSRKISN